MAKPRSIPGTRFWRNRITTAIPNARLRQNRRDHERSEADGVSGDDQERQLPDEGDPDEAVEVLGVGDRRWIFPPDPLLHEILREEHDETVDPGEPEDDARESHGLGDSRIEKRWCCPRMKIRSGAAAGVAINTSPIGLVATSENSAPAATT